MEEKTIKKVLGILFDAVATIGDVCAYSILFYFAWNNVHTLFCLNKIGLLNAVSIATLIFIFIRIIRIAIGKINNK